MTPSSHRFIDKMEEDTGARITTNDQSFIATRPKTEVGSTGTTWYKVQEKYESEFSSEFRGICAMLKDKAYSFCSVLQ